jgi:hypothetical protein
MSYPARSGARFAGFFFERRPARCKIEDIALSSDPCASPEYVVVSIEPQARAETGRP